jgi:hypothetical protein
MGLVLLANWLIDHILQADTLIDLFLEHEATATDFNMVMAGLPLLCLHPTEGARVH